MEAKSIFRLLTLNPKPNPYRILPPRRSLAKKQQMDTTQPKYPPLNLSYPGLQCLTTVGDPSIPEVWVVPDFLTAAEADQLISVSTDCLEPSPVVGSVTVSGSREEAKAVVASSRTSLSCYLHRDDVPTLLGKVEALLNPAPTFGNPTADGIFDPFGFDPFGINAAAAAAAAATSAAATSPHSFPPLDSRNCELPQVARYHPGQFYAAHFDAFDTSTVAGLGFVSNGGQRTHTVLIYLNDVSVEHGGGTTFHSGRLRADCLPDDMSVPMLVYPNILRGGCVVVGKDGAGITVQPKKGMAVVFFPSHNVYDKATGAKTGVKLDGLGLHEARPVLEGGVKHVSQVWVRTEKTYSGMESKRLQTKI